MSSTTIHQPHDKLFKQAMAEIRVAKDFFTEKNQQILISKFKR